MKVIWPESYKEYFKLAEVLIGLVGGKPDVVARFFDFEVEKGKRLKGWAPWKGKRVPMNYEAMPGQKVLESPDKDRPGKVLRSLAKPFSAENLVKHLRGVERLGVYVLNDDDRCSFLAADFDDHSGELDPAAVLEQVIKFVETCETHDWIAHVERSKSGAGYHVWLFFDEPVDAGKVRAIGRWLFEESESVRDDEDFDTFDRFFPAQAKRPTTGKGYGNLIGLPLCGQQDYALGRTAWVDKQGEIIADPVGYLADIVAHGRNKASVIDAFMQEWDLDVDDDPVYSGAQRDPNQKLDPAEDFSGVVDRCKFLQWVSDPANQARVSEPLWFSMVSNAARFDVDGWIHEASSSHAGYSVLETDNKIQHSRCSSGPHKCKSIRENGFKGCPKNGCKVPGGNIAASPAGLIAWPKSQKRTNKNTFSDHPKGAPIELSDEAIDRATQRMAEVNGEDLPIYEETNSPWPEVAGFEIDNSGVRGPGTVGPILLRPLWVHACTYTTSGRWGVSIKFFDIDYKLRSCTFPRQKLHETGGVLGRELAEMGCLLVSGKEKWVCRMINLMEGECVRRIQAASRMGWFDSSAAKPAFVLPNRVIGIDDSNIVFQPDTPTDMQDTLCGRGSLKEWQSNIMEPCTGSPLMQFALMTAFVGPLLKLCQAEGGGFHIFGTTSLGKTTAAQICASVWGNASDPQSGPEVTSLRKWNSTAAALETVAEVHNDTVLCLDEISEADPHMLGKVIYQLAGGVSKMRSQAQGGLRRMTGWRIVFLSTGEKSVRHILSGVGQAQKGGQRVRLPDIPAEDPITGEGTIIEEFYGKTPEQFVLDLKLSCSKFFGTAGPKFAEYLIAEAEKAGGWLLFSGILREELRKFEAVLQDHSKDLKLPKEGKRTLRRFALVALAGARAHHAGIISWSVEDIFVIALSVIKRWVSEMGEEQSELERGLGYLRGGLISHNDRFRWISEGGGHSKAPIHNQLGFRVESYYLLTPAALRELCGEYDPKVLLAELKRNDFLWHDKGRMTKKSPKIESYKNTRPYLYWIDVKFMGETVEAGESDFEDEEEEIF